MLPQTRSRNAGLNLKRLCVLAAVISSCLAAALLGCRRSEPVEGQSRAVIAIRSADFSDGSPIPSRYTCDGANSSPQLQWQSPPSGSKSLALVMDDPDAPIDWVHWLVFNIPPSVQELPEAASPHGSIPAGSAEGTTSFGRPGYGGPCPPHGTHHYVFRLYALDLEPDLPSNATRQQLGAAINGHILAQGQIVSTYKRSGQ